MSTGLMRMALAWLLVGCFSAAAANGAQAAPAAISDDDFVVVSGPASPRVAMALRHEGGALSLTVDVAADRSDGTGTSLSVGLAADKKVMLATRDAQVTLTKGLARYTFSIPDAALVNQEAGWRKLRLAMAASWSDGPLGQERRRERYRHLGSGAAHRGLASSETEWAPLDLEEYAKAVADRKARIAISFQQPMDGKATIVIEDHEGKRVRNLIGGEAIAKGPQSITWDGLDDAGQVVTPGTYRWRSIHHPGVTPQHLFSFCADPGSNHSSFCSAAANGELTFFAAPLTEGGFAMISLDKAGNLVRGYNYTFGLGLDRAEIAADAKYVYVAHDGGKWGQQVDRRKPDWKTTYDLTLERFEIASGNLSEFPGGRKFVTVASTEVGPGSAGNRPDRVGLQGMALLDGKLYISDSHSQSLLVVDAASGEKTRQVKLENPGTVAADGTRLLAASGADIVRVNPASGAATVVIRSAGKPQGIAVDGGGAIYVSDGASHSVKVFTADGKSIRTLGKPGGPYVGPYDGQRMISPAGLALGANGWLWVTEHGRWTPKRLAAYDAQTGKVTKELFGPTAYGASGGGFDAEDHSRWIGLDTLWTLDFERKTAMPQGILRSSRAELPGATHYQFLHQDGRTFVIALSGATSIYELQPGGALKALAMVGSVHRYCFALDWNPPKAFIDAFNKAYPNRKKYVAGEIAEKGPGVLWVDRSGDGAMQADELEFSTSVENFAGAYWGNDFHDLSLRLPANVAGKRVLVTLTPSGYYPGGAPKYPSLNEACLAGKPIDLAENEVETAVDRFGGMVVNSDPVMKSFAPDGRLQWTYPNRWSGVHGSHQAPLPQVGQLQGALFFTGMAPLDEQADVFVMNGNHGRFFVMTSDGLYLDEMFKDVRLGGAVDAYMIGGECFGGTFGKSAKDGNYYLQAGGNEYRVFRLDGLREAKRLKGDLAVTAAQVVAAERNLARQAAQATSPKTAEIPFVPKPPAIDGKDDDWQGPPTVQWDKSGQFAVKVRAAWDQANLYLYYAVSDPSPWVNGGKDWQSLFKSGDSIDLQLGTNPDASPTRSAAAPGDLRLLVAPMGDRNVAVLYRHRLAGAKDPVVFQSPWRSEKVDSVRMLDEAKIAVIRSGNQYTVELAIPLAALGLTVPQDKTFRADFGVLFGDAEGKMTGLRSYWSNQNTGLVSDVPGEILLTPNLWGTVHFDREGSR